MQTFMPCTTYEASARALDRRRLGKQRVENMQITRALHVPNAGWANHPVTRAWKGHECSLMDYQLAICSEWMGRGYKDTCLLKTTDLHLEYGHADGSPCTLNTPMPPWFGLRSTRAAYRAVLIRKDPDHYRPLWPRADDSLELIYPV